MILGFSNFCAFLIARGGLPRRSRPAAVPAGVLLLLALLAGGAPAQNPPQEQPAPKQPAAQPPAKAEPSKPAAKEDEDFVWVERPTPWGVQRFKVPKSQAGAFAPTAPSAPGAAGAAAAPAPQGAPSPAAPSPTEPGVGGAAPPAAQAPAQPAAPAAGTKAPAQATAPALKPGEARVSLHLENANLSQVITIIAEQLKMNYIVDPNVRGVVNVSTLGELNQEDLLPLLQAILRANGATAVQSGSFWRIMPLKDVQRVPIPIGREGAALPADDRVVMSVVALRYVTAADMSKILGPYLSEAGQIVSHEPANILLITDTSRSMKRLMDLIALFDTDTLAQQRIRLFPIQNTQAKDLIRDLQDIFRAYALSDKATAVRLLPIDRLNTIMAVSTNPSIFKEVEQWIEKLDKPIPTRSAGIQNFVYRVQNSSAENLAIVISSLYGAGGGAGRGVRPGGPAGAVGGAGLGSAIPIAATGGGGAAAGMGVSAMPAAEITSEAGGGSFQGAVRIAADPITNSLLVQATAQDYETLRKTIEEMDIVPRQVLIEAKVFEVTLDGALSFGVEAFLQQKSSQQRMPVGQFSTSAGAFSNAGLSFSVGTLVGRARELMLFLNAQENRSRTRVISAPTILASDNLDARIEVGSEIPILTSQGVVPGAQSGGTSLFTNTVQQRDTGVILQVTPRINPSGLVSLRIQQEVSAPQAPPPGSSIGSPSIQKRTLQTQVTVRDGETIALGGIIAENQIYSKNRVPLLGDIPGLGLLFGSTSYSTTRTELIVLLTPHVIRDEDEAQEATDEFKSKLKDLRKTLRKYGN